MNLRRQPEHESTPDNVVGNDHPLTLAMAFLRHAGYGRDEQDWSDDVTPDKAATMRYWREDFYVFDRCAYRRVVPEELRARVTRFLNGVQVHHRGPDGVAYDRPLRVTDNVVAETLKQMRAVAQVFGVDAMPAWLDLAAPGGADRPDVADVIAFRNGWVDAQAWAAGDQERPHDPTPLWFSESAIPCAFDPAAGCPLWLRFLDQSLRGDAESIGLLQEWVGYCLTGDTSLQKMLWLYGKGGTGKSTFTTVLAHLVGARNTVRFELWDFMERFALSTWLGKTLAISADAEMSVRGPDTRRIIGQIKAITGEDDRSIDRKNKEILERIRLRTRLVLCVNRLPSLPSAGGALERRSLIVPFEPAKGGIEKDTYLAQKLMGEAAGIAQWAMEGLRRLRRRGDFPVTAKALEMGERMAELSSHIPSFIEDCCELQDPTPDGRPYEGRGNHYSVRKEHLYAAYVDWCKTKRPGHTPEDFNRFCESVYDNTDAKPYRPQVTDPETGRVARPTLMQWIRLREDVVSRLMLEQAQPVGQGVLPYDGY